jgi:formylglycine-generating enzyme required for sulfatase activity/serine/threonine protein kinase
MAQVSLALAPGVVISGLRIDRELGHGAFGVTYLVTELQSNQSFALKEFLPRDIVERDKDGKLGPAGQEHSEAYIDGLKHFLEEAQLVSQLRHANVVEVLRSFEANGTAYLLMPHYRGEPLDKLLKRSGTFTPDEALALSNPLLEALEHIHAKGLVHQDIKPANIYITEDGQPILLDFGAAGQRLEADLSTRWKLGSEGYAALEQSENPRRIGPWTDIYALAATLYRCVSGKIPVAAPQRKQAVKNNEPDPLSPIETLVPGKHFAGIHNAMRVGLALEPESRPQNVAQWRPSFKLHKAAKGVPNIPLVNGIEQEGREWLPLILLSTFGIILLSAVIYLFIGQDPQPGDPVADQPAVDTETARPSNESGFASPEETARWKSALDADTAYGYQKFMEDFPKSIHEDQALVHLARLDHQAWGYAEAEGSRSAIETYLQNFPEGLHLADAEILLHEIQLAQEAAQRELIEKEQQDEAAWQSARTERTLASMDGYLAEWPGGLHSDEARVLRREIESDLNDSKAFQAARKLNSIDAYESYLNAFPKGRNVALALEAIDDLTLRPGKTFKDCQDCPTMVVVPAGSFWQGSEDTAPLALKMETPKRMVTLAEPFAVGVFEITMEQWDRCVADGACNNRPPDNGWGRGSRPAIMVSWNDTQEFTNWLSRKTGQSYSLPSESQWEYIARAGEESDWLGGGPAGICAFGNIAGGESGFKWQHQECSDGAAIETLPVGSFRANAFGVYDVVGNVAEWTLDCMNLSYLDAPADGSAWGRGICSSRITRGGSWFTGSREVRLPARFNLKNGDRNDFTGFRVVRRVEAL